MLDLETVVHVAGATSTEKVSVTACISKTRPIAVRPNGPGRLGWLRRSRGSLGRSSMRCLMAVAA